MLLISYLSLLEVKESFMNESINVKKKKESVFLEKSFL